MSEPIIELLKKIKALADKGIGGEKDNAERKLELLMQKHGITLESLEKHLVSYRDFKYPPGTEAIAHHVAWSVIPGTKLYGRKSSKNVMIVEADDFQELEIRYLLDLYLRAWKKEVGSLLVAFVLKNDLGVDKKDSSNPRVLSKEEQEKIRRMMEGVDKTNRNKLLGK